ncbi:short-chain fatty acyl-CoA regulator family protein [Pseudoxanthomonas sp.]|uniref:short-chain fatty acyl-CoA regulator family protein n=1 Tax=Pseudoxanthomonas sp. TaxID=1871049 RepID=UPI00262F123B|nr:short-chain fatty acyl-CoA regulator family protein [Pseudoxanthomonas sp.]WDS37861.1 MAG: short-chain fatty acyl-CoA regulator family protein [Pseudoxanthomonas sp.]
MSRRCSSCRPSRAGNGGDKTFAVTLGCNPHHADRMVYARGIDTRTDNAVAIGPGCRTCEWNDCLQRAFPALPQLGAVVR